MGDGNLNIILALAGLIFLISSSVASEKSDHACPGPIKFYEELGCTPVFKNSGDSCPIRFDCDKWANLTDDQCLLNGYVYQHGEHIREEDSNPCEDCTCNAPHRWSCASGLRLNFSESQGEPGLECYQKPTAFGCLPGKTVCVKENERPTCVVDGKIYKDGEYFLPSGREQKICYCGEGYTGENIEPFCASPKHTWCAYVLVAIDKIRANCIPVYSEDQSMNTECDFLYSRCPRMYFAPIPAPLLSYGNSTTLPDIFDLLGEHGIAVGAKQGISAAAMTDSDQNEKDHVINPKPECKTENPSEFYNMNMLCKFGNMTMKIGEELNQDVDHNYQCQKCVCEVPPIPTCRDIKCNRSGSQIEASDMI